MYSDDELFQLAERMNDAGDCPDGLLDMAHLALIDHDMELTAVEAEKVMDYLCEMILNDAEG
jgi:hypothetical protein